MGPAFPGFPTCLFMTLLVSGGKTPNSTCGSTFPLQNTLTQGVQSHEGLLGLGVTETPRGLRGAQREALGAVPPSALTGREGRCSAAGTGGPECTQSPFFPSVFRMYSEPLGCFLLASTCQTSQPRDSFLGF